MLKRLFPSLKYCWRHRSWESSCWKFEVTMKRALSTSHDPTSNQYEKNNDSSMMSSVDIKAAGHTCQFCGEVYPSRNKLFIHLRNRHVDNGENVVNNLNNSNNNQMNNNHNQEQQSQNHQKADNNNEEDISMTVPISEDLQFLHNDDFCCVVRKPQGMATMGVGGGVLAVHNHPLLRIAEHDTPHCGYRKARPCHRLDALTGGVLLCAKTRDTELVLRHAFRERHVVKHYLAVVAGRVSVSRHIGRHSGLITLPLSGQACVTRFTLLQETRSADYGEDNWVSTLLLCPITGRKHQLRRHMQLLGHPIVGDRRYTSALSWCREFPQLFLWSVGITLPHPRYYLKRLETPHVDGDTPLKDGDTPVQSGDTPLLTNHLPSDDDEEDETAIEVATPSDGTHVVSSDGFVSKAERLLATIRDPHDILHVELSEPPYYEAFRQRQKQLFELKEAQKLKQQHL